MEVSIYINSVCSDTYLSKDILRIVRALPLEQYIYIAAALAFWCSPSLLQIRLKQYEPHGKALKQHCRSSAQSSMS